VSLSASTQSIFERLARAIGHTDLITDARFASNPQRVRNSRQLDEIIGTWIGGKTLEEVCDAFLKQEVAFSPVFTIKDIFEDEHFLNRRSLIDVPDADFGHVVMQSVVPRFSHTPGVVVRSGPRLGEDNLEIYGDWLGMSPQEIQRMQDAGVI